MSTRALPWIGLALLAFAWAGPLPRLVPVSFAAHMTLHMTVVAIAVPLIAIGIALRFAGFVARNEARALAIAVTLIDVVVIWGWHTPYLHHASRSEPITLAIEQASFAAVTLLVWVVAFAGSALFGALALFFTSMHMTLLGALIGLAPRAAYHGDHAHGAAIPFGLTPLEDQQLGGVIMLAVGGAVYLAAGLTLVARVLRRPAS